MTITSKVSFTAARSCEEAEAEREERDRVPFFDDCPIRSDLDEPVGLGHGRQDARALAGDFSCDPASRRIGLEACANQLAATGLLFHGEAGGDREAAGQRPGGAREAQ